MMVGSGAGTFQDVYPMYRIDTPTGGAVWDKAHNDYVELFLGLGVPLATLVLLGMLMLFGKVLRGVFARRRDSHYAVMAAGVSVMVGLHEFVDFGLQIQANALAFAMLLGIGVAQSIGSLTK